MPEQLGEQLGEVDVVRWRDHSIARGLMDARCGSLDYPPRAGATEPAAAAFNAIDNATTLSRPFCRVGFFHPCILSVAELLLNVVF